MRSLLLAGALVAGATVPALAQDAAAGEKVFTQCRACHQNARRPRTPSAGAERVIGRKAGTIEGYSYSAANKNSGLTWDEATFREYIKDLKARCPAPRWSMPASRTSSASMTSSLSSSSTTHGQEGRRRVRGPIADALRRAAEAGRPVGVA
jgi:cytochrome c